MPQNRNDTSNSIYIIGRGFLYFGLIVSLIPKGSVSYFYIFLSSSIFSIILIINTFPNRIALENIKLIRKSFIIIITIILYALFQAASFDQNIFANPNWVYAKELISSENNSISVSPDQTRWAIIQTATPFIVFLSVLMLANSDKNALKVWKAIISIGIMFSLFAMLNLLFWPEYILFEKRVHDTKNLTGFFVNRNTAATYLGVCIVASTTMLIFRNAESGEFWKILFGKNIRGKIVKKYDVILLGIGIFTMLIALHLTNSRGGIFATYVSILLLVILIYSHRSTGIKLFIVMASTLIIFMVVFFIYGQNTLVRFWQTNMESETFRICAYLSTIDAIKKNWIFGTGLGTYFEIFPVYRRESCGIYNQWAFAHNFYLEGYLTFGVIFVPILIYVYWILIRNFVSGMSNRVRYKVFPVGGLAIVLLVTVHSSVDFSLQIHAVAVLVAAVLGTAAAFSSKTKTQKRSVSGVDVLSKG